MNEDQLIQHYIQLDPYLGPAEARLRYSGQHVWAIIGDYLFDAGQDPNVVARDYDIPVDAVRAALAYYRRNQAAIDFRMAENGAPVMG